MKSFRVLLLALLIVPAASARPAAEDDEWRSFGHALALVQAFVRIAAQGDGPQAESKAIAALLGGCDAEANRALAALFAEATSDMPQEHRARLAEIARDIAAIARRGPGGRAGPADCAR
jgi:hypothetical protein